MSIVTLFLALIAILLLILNVRLYGSSHRQTLEQRQTDFVSYVDTVQLDYKNPLLEVSKPQCSQSSDHAPVDCTLSKTFIYKLDDNYRNEGKRIFAYLKSKGFDYRNDSKYKYSVSKKLNNTAISDNLSNSEPIIVDLFNDHKNVRVRVNIGDRSRILSYASSTDLDKLQPKQLIAGLQFYSP